MSNIFKKETGSDWCGGGQILLVSTNWLYNTYSLFFFVIHWWFCLYHSWQWSCLKHTHACKHTERTKFTSQTSVHPDIILWHIGQCNIETSLWRACLLEYKEKSYQEKDLLSFIYSFYLLLVVETWSSPPPQDYLVTRWGGDKDQDQKTTNCILKISEQKVRTLDSWWHWWAAVPALEQVFPDVLLQKTNAFLTFGIPITEFFLSYC